MVSGCSSQRLLVFCCRLSINASPDPIRVALDATLTLKTSQVVEPGRLLGDKGKDTIVFLAANNGPMGAGGREKPIELHAE